MITRGATEIKQNLFVRFATAAVLEVSARRHLYELSFNPELPFTILALVTPSFQSASL